MAQLMNPYVTSTHVASTHVTSTPLDFPHRAVRSSVRNGRSQVAQRMTEAGATVVSLPDGLLITRQAARVPGIALLSTKDAVRRLEHARNVADGLGEGPLLFSCTHARDAQSLIDDDDARDRLHMSGARTLEGFHVFCGGIDAAIRRVSAFATHADVVCYTACKVDLIEAECFASAVRASFPGKPLGMGFFPRPQELQWSGLDHLNHERQLRRLGYDYYFSAQSFPTFPRTRPWVLFDDGGEPAHTKS